MTRVWVLLEWSAVIFPLQGRGGFTSTASARERQLRDLLRSLGPCDSETLVAAAQQRWGGATPARVQASVARAIGAGLIRDDAGVLHPVDDQVPGSVPVGSVRQP